MPRGYGERTGESGRRGCRANGFHLGLQPSRGWRRAGPPSGRAEWDPLGLLPHCSALRKGLSG